MGKNLQKIQSMLKGEGTGKIQVGVGDHEIKPTREVGDKWFDSDGVEWEQKDGYYSKVSKLNRGIADKCSDCGKYISGTKSDQKLFAHRGRCYYCQINFEAKLKTWPIKYWAWMKLQALSEWDSIEKAKEEWVMEKYNMDQKKTFDKSVVNALANENIETGMLEKK